MKIRLTQIDGKLPNLALMRLAAWHRSIGDEVFWEHAKTRQLGEPEYDRVYGSAIFSTSAKAVALLRSQFEVAIVGGSGGNPVIGPPVRTECYVPSQFRGLDYSGWPNFTASLGYCSRGCRSKCKFCVVPWQEGSIYSVASVAQIWRGPGFPKHLHLLDNDFFGNPDWREIVEEILAGGFKVCINQGINVRRIGDEEAEALARLRCRDAKFKRPRLYMAWDNIGDERVFFAGVDRLERVGIPAGHLMVYMLIGFDPKETWERIMYRYHRMRDRGVLPYPMVHDRLRHSDPEHWRKMKRFASWVVSPAQGACDFQDFRPDHKPAPAPGPMLELMGV